MGWSFWNNLFDYIPLVLREETPSTKEFSFTGTSGSFPQIIEGANTGRKVYLSTFKQTVEGTGADYQTFELFNTGSTTDSIYVSVAGVEYIRVDDVDNPGAVTEPYEFNTGNEGQTIIRFGDSGTTNVPANGDTILIYSAEKDPIISSKVTIVVDGISFSTKVTTLNGVLPNANVYTQGKDTDGRSFIVFHESTAVSSPWAVAINYMGYDSDIRLFAKILAKNLDELLYAVKHYTDIRNIDTALEKYLDEIANELGFPLLYFQDLNDKRELIRNAVEFYRRKGSDLGMEIIRFMLRLRVDTEQLWSNDYVDFIPEADIPAGEKMNPVWMHNQYIATWNGATLTTPGSGVVIDTVTYAPRVSVSLPDNPPGTSSKPLMRGSVRMEVDSNILAFSKHRRSTDAYNVISNFGDFVLSANPNIVLGEVDYGSGLVIFDTAVLASYFTAGTVFNFDWQYREVIGTYFPTPHVRVSVIPEDTITDVAILQRRRKALNKLIEFLRPAHVVFDLTYLIQLVDNLTTTDPDQDGDASYVNYLDELLGLMKGLELEDEPLILDIQLIQFDRGDYSAFTPATTVWATATDYVVGDFVTDTNEYLCIKDHTSNATYRPGPPQGADWAVYWQDEPNSEDDSWVVQQANGDRSPIDYRMPGDRSGQAGIVVDALDAAGALFTDNPTGLWSSGTTYIIGDIVVEGTPNVIYRCILGNTNQQPPNATYWTKEVDFVQRLELKITDWDSSVSPQNNLLTFDIVDGDNSAHSVVGLALGAGLTSRKSTVSGTHNLSINNKLYIAINEGTQHNVNVAGMTWGIGNNYVVEDVVVDGSPKVAYVCVSAHLSAAGNQPPNAVYWKLLSPYTITLNNSASVETLDTITKIRTAVPGHFLGHTRGVVPLESGPRETLIITAS